MGMTRVGPRHQVTIPKDVFDKIQLEVGDFLDVRLNGGAITMVPTKLIPKDQAWFYTPEWQKKEKEADQDMASGHVSGPFSTAKALIKHLRNAKRRAKK